VELSLIAEKSGLKIVDDGSVILVYPYKTDETQTGLYLPYDGKEEIIAKPIEPAAVEQPEQDKITAVRRDFDEKRFYAGIYGVFAMEGLDEQQTKDKFTERISVDFDDSGGFMLCAGYVVNEYFTTEFQGEYIASFDADFGDGNNDELRVANLILNAKATYPGDKFVPFAMFGLGAMNAHEDISYDEAVSKTTDWGVAVLCGVGLEMFVSPDISLGIKTTYTLGTGSTDHIKYLSVSLGAAYHF